MHTVMKLCAIGDGKGKEVLMLQTIGYSIIC